MANNSSSWVVRAVRNLFILCIFVFSIVFFTGCSNVFSNTFGQVLTALRGGSSWSVGQEAVNTDELRIYSLPIGQGDAHLIQMGEHFSLIDTGDVDHRSAIVAMLHDHGVKKIDRIIITHPHSDHLGGFWAIANEFPVGEVYDNGESIGSSVYNTYLKTVKEKNIPRRSLHKGDVVDFGGGVTFTVYAPWQDTINEKNGHIDQNNNSIVGKLVYKKFSMLFTGDAEKEEENRLIKEQNTKLSSRVLKVGHHGSNTSSQSDFIRSVRPVWAVISVGYHNDYGHPNSNTLNRLSKENVAIYRTDENGTITITTNGEEWQIQKER